MGDSGELADGLVFLIAQQVVELRIDLLQIIGDLGDGLFQCHLCHDAADAGEHGGVELPWLDELQMFDDAPRHLVRVIGDAAKVSTITNAVYWGYHAALDI